MQAESRLWLTGSGVTADLATKITGQFQPVVLERKHRNALQNAKDSMETTRGVAEELQERANQQKAGRVDLQMRAKVC